MGTKVIAISGTSGGGKSTTVGALARRVPNSIALSIEDGDYEKNSGIEDLAKWEEDGWDVSLWNLQSLADDLTVLMQKGYDYIFFDYPFGYMQKQIAGFISLSVYIDTPLDVALARRTLRDGNGKSASDLLGEMDWYLRNRHLFTLSNDHQRTDAELIVDGTLPTDEICKVILNRAMLCNKHDSVLEQSTEAIKENFEKRNIQVLWFDTFREIKEYLLNAIGTSDTVGIGNSQTLKSMEITEALSNRGNVVYDKTFGHTQDEIKNLKRKALLADCYISSSNAVSADGSIINIDHSGNRVAAITYGPDRVFIVVGKNKITVTKEEAMQRAKNTAAPLNAKRAGYSPPCTVTGYCVDCNSPERVCNIVSIIEGQHVNRRLTLLIADEAEGF